MAIINYDCGALSNVIITSNNYSGVINIASGSTNGDITIDRNMEPLVFMCSGDMAIDSQVNAINVLVTAMNLQGVWSENFLMGLAGVVCGSLLAYVCVKYAV
ncbi:MAG: hypothetical protein ACE5GV_07855 [Candidatus Scalindua sp.]